MSEPIKLKRSIGLTFLTFYGLGNILGAGIYVLVGKVAGAAGYFTPVSFLLASIVAGFTALTYAELSARLPLSAGEAVYLHKAFNYRWLSVTVGLMIALAGIVSAATISRGFVGYLAIFFTLPDMLVISVLVFALGAIAIWGISQSVGIAVLITLVEITGLLLVVYAGGHSLTSLPERLPELIPPGEFLVWQGIFMGAFLAFYAYIGFEDMVNIAEEVKVPERNMPCAIISALAISTLFYIAIALIGTLSVPPQELSASNAPLALIYEHATGKSPVIISQIALFAVINGALIQIIMSSRILYGMSCEGWLPAGLSHIHRRTQTPLPATILVAVLVLVFALWLPIVTLAKATSYIVLTVFALVNAALLMIKKKEPGPVDIKIYPAWVPALGLLLTLGLIFVEIYSHL